MTMAGRAQSASPRDEDVDVHRPAPFDAWCLAPQCTSSAAGRPLPAPPAPPPSSASGVVEQQLRDALASSLRRALESNGGAELSRPGRDAVEAIVVAVAGGPNGLDSAGGLGRAALRVGLVARTSALLTADGACAGARRLDAIYEGLGSSVALAPLGFPLRRGRVAASCVATAMASARLVDGAALRGLTAPSHRAAAVKASEHLERAREACAPGAGARATPLPADGTVGAFARWLRAGATGKAAPGSPCATALEALRGASPAAFDALARAGLADASLVDLATTFAAVDDPRTTVIVRVATSTATMEDHRALARGVADVVPVGSSELLRRALEALPGAVVETGDGVTLDPTLVLARLAETYGLDENGRPNLRSLLGLSSTPWLVDLEGGIPSFDFANAKVVADASLGYATKTWGVVGRGYIDTFDLAGSAYHADYLHTGGRLEGYALFGPFADTLRLELRLAAGFDYYDTTAYPKSASTMAFDDFDSRIGRVTLLAGLRWGTPLDRASVRLAVGGGGQYEDPDRTRVGDGASVSFTSEQRVTAHAQGNLLFGVRVVPGYFGARLRSEASYFRVTRDALAFTSAGAATLVTSSVATTGQGEVRTRLFLDAEVAALVHRM